MLGFVPKITDRGMPTFKMGRAPESNFFSNRHELTNNLQMEFSRYKLWRSLLYTHENNANIDTSQNFDGLQSPL